LYAFSGTLIISFKLNENLYLLNEKTEIIVISFDFIDDIIYFKYIYNDVTYDVIFRGEFI
jgi:hypothetical protein